MKKQNNKTRTDFLKYWFSKTEHDLEIRCLPSKEQLFSRDLAKIEEFLDAHIEENVYFGVCSRKGGGSKEHVKEVLCLWADLDFKDYKGGEKEAYERLKAFRYAPTIVIYSGNGFHAYWFLKEAEEPSEKIEAILRGIARDLQSDPSVCELARVMRMPDTFNYKNDEKKPVRIIQRNDSEYLLSDFQDFAVEDTGREPGKVDRQTVEEINNKCAFLHHAYQNKELPETLWYAMLSNLSRLSPGGPSLCHNYSQGHPGYDKKETDQKILHAQDGGGPHTCQYIREQGFACGMDCGVRAPVVKLQKKDPPKDLSSESLAVQEWTELLPFDDTVNLPCFPVDTLPDWLRESVEMVSEINQVDAGLSASIALAVLSTACAKKGVFDLITHREPLNIYTAPILSSGERKSSTVSVLTTPI
jgi:hypothetical protein